MTQIRTIINNCASLSGIQFGNCFANGMQQSGASPQAIAFTRKINNDGFMRDFRQEGKVSVAYVYFPFRANENQGAYLVNGTPALIDIDNQQLLAKTALLKNPTYQNLSRKYPNITMFTGDRGGTNFLTVEKQAGGGQRFIVPYSLRNQCHACTLVGTINYAFDFNNNGKFLGTRLVSVIPAASYAAGGPTGMTTAYSRANSLAVLRTEWQPAPEVSCPANQPIASCAIAPAQQRYTVNPHPGSVTTKWTVENFSSDTAVF